MILKFNGITAIALVLLGAVGVQAEPQTLRLEADPSADRYPALQEFLSREGYWPEDIQAVLGPLEGSLSLDNGTPDAHLVETLDDIPGLRPLPEGVTEFLHRHHSIYYVAVSDDRLLVGVSRLVTQERGQTLESEFNFEKFDLIEGRAESLAGSSPWAISAFLFAHDSFFGVLLRILLFGAAFIVFLALRLRRGPALLEAEGLDPEVAFHRRRAQVRLFQIAGFIWLGLLAAIYGLMHFSGRILFMESVATGEGPSFSLLRTLALEPDRMRLLGFGLAEGLALLMILALGLWSGALGGRRESRVAATRGTP